MARNVGTAVGVTLLGGVYMHSLQAALPAAVPGAVRAQAGQFQVGVSAVAHVGTASAIVQGFLALNVAAALCCGLAVVALLMMRNGEKSHDKSRWERPSAI